MRTETILSKEDSELKSIKKVDKIYTKEELDEMTVKLARAHNLI